MEYDLIVVGNGIAASVLLFYFFQDPKNSHLKVAQIYEDNLFPPCSLSSTATVSLNGVEEGVSPIGNDLRAAFFEFSYFVEKYKPEGVFKIKQFLTFTNEKYKGKMLRRFKKIENHNCEYLKNKEGMCLDSFAISPTLYLNWLTKENSKHSLERISAVVEKFCEVNGDGLEVILKNKKSLMGKKIVFATGAYSEIHSHFEEMNWASHSEILAGSYLEKKINLNCDSFKLTIDESNLIYRSVENTLLLGTAPSIGPVFLPDLLALKKIYLHFQNNINFDLGDFYDFKIHTGLRHKGIKRRSLMIPLNESKSAFLINGFYKNGFSLANLYGKKFLVENS